MSRVPQAEAQRPQPREKSLTQRAARGAMVTTGGQVLRLMIQVVGTAALARLLGPSDYGLVAMAMVIVGIGEIFREFGLSAAAVQAPSVSKGQRANLFWMNTGLAVGLFLLTVILAEPIARLFDEPDLVNLSRVLALSFILNGLSAQYRASLNRSMRFTALTVADLASRTIGLAVGIVTALIGWDYWSLAAMQLAEAGLSTLFLVLVARWWPGWPRRGEDMSHFWRYGRNLVGSQLVSYAGSHADAFILGLRLGPAALGLYDRGNRLIKLPLAQLRAPLTSVALPVMARVQDDQKRYEQAMLRGQIAMGYTLVPLMAVLAGLSAPVVSLVLGDNWLDSAPILSVLAAATVLQLLAYIGYWVYLSRALTKQLFHFTFVSAGVRIVCILIGSQWGAVGVAFGVMAATAILWPASFLWLHRATVVPLGAIYHGAVRILIMASLSGGAAFAVATYLPVDAPVVQLAVGGLAALAVYGIGFAVPMIRRDQVVVLDLLKAGRG